MTKARDIASAIPAPSTVSSAELGFLDGVTSAIQTQIDTKAPSSTAVTLTGTQTLTNKTLTNPVIASVVNNTLTSTTGDMIYASGANTPARLGIGSTGNVLTVAGGIPSWATPAAGGGMTLLSTTTLSGTETTISSISGSYKNLLLLIEGVYTNNDNTLLQLYFNSDTTKLNYNTFGLRGTTADDRSGNSGSNARIAYINNNTTNSLGCGIINIFNYADTGIKYWNGGFNSLSNSARAGTFFTGTFSGSTITSIKFDADGSSFSGGTVKVYGVN